MSSNPAALIDWLTAAAGFAAAGAAAVWAAWQALRAAAGAPITPEERRFISDLLQTLVPFFIVIHAAIATVLFRQRRNRLQAALARFMAAKTLFWIAIEISFHARFTAGWFVVDAAALGLTFATGLEFSIELVRRYGLGRGLPDDGGLG